MAKLSQDQFLNLYSSFIQKLRHKETMLNKDEKLEKAKHRAHLFELWYLDTRDQEDRFDDYEKEQNQDPEWWEGDHDEDVSTD